MNKRLLVVLAAVIGGLGIAGTGAAQKANVMTGTPTAAEFVDALSPPRKTRGIRPMQAEQVAPPEVNLPIVNFEFGSAQLTEQARTVLDQLAIALQSQELSSSRFRIEGHTDSVGSEVYNQTLSERRAQAVRDYLASRNVDPNALTSVGVGEADPLDPTDGAAPINRRVAVINLGAS